MCDLVYILKAGELYTATNYNKIVKQVILIFLLYLSSIIFYYVICIQIEY